MSSPAGRADGAPAAGALECRAMAHVEHAVWRVPGKVPLRGVVVARPTKTGKVTVKWDDGREERVSQTDPVVRFAYEGTNQLKWLLNPDELDERFRKDQLSVFLDVLRDSAQPLSAAKLRKALIDAGTSPAAVKSAWDTVKPTLKDHEHVAVKGDSYRWSNEIVDPHAALRALSPEGALQRLLKGRLKQAQRDVLAEIIRAGFR
jgi:hypothetical protein